MFSVKSEQKEKLITDWNCKTKEKQNNITKEQKKRLKQLLKQKQN